LRRAQSAPFYGGLCQNLIQIELRSKMPKASFERAMVTVKAGFIKKIKIQLKQADLISGRNLSIMQKLPFKVSEDEFCTHLLLNSFTLKLIYLYVPVFDQLCIKLGNI
jgi:hypothetical protein